MERKKKKKEQRDFRTVPEKETKATTEELEQTSTELPMATEEPSTPRVRAREEDLTLAESPLSRRRITKTWGSPKREAREAELVEVEEARSKLHRVSCILPDSTSSTSYVCQVTTKRGHDIPVAVNEDLQENELEWIAQEPLLWYEPELPKDLVVEGMKKEIKSIRDFDVYEEVDANTLTPEQLKACIPTRWVHRPKGLEVKSRVVVKGYKQLIEDKDDTFASTPSFVTLKLLLTLALSRHWYCIGADVSTAFLHALWSGETTYVWPPEEFYPQGGVLWKLKKALYGLKNSPKLWQDHFANVMKKLDFVRCKSDANSYKHEDCQLYVLCYVDDLLIVGNKDKVMSTFNMLSTELVMKQTGQLVNEGDKLDFLGRQLVRASDSILITMDTSYVGKILAEANMTTCRKATTPGSDTLKSKIEDEEDI